MASPREAYLLDAVHTPRGRRDGSLAGVHPVELLGVPLQAIVARNGFAAREVDDVVAGCVSQAGEQGSCLARAAWLAAGLPLEVPGVALDRFCGSGLQAVGFAAMAVRSGFQDLVVAGGVESMSRCPIGSSWTKEQPAALSARYALTSQFEAAERIAARWDITREDCDRFALASQQRAANAWERARFENQICPVQLPSGTLERDEHLRPTTSYEKLAKLDPVTGPGGIVTAGNASGVVDGAAAVLVGSGRKAEELGLRRRARIAALDVVGSDPELMLTGPIPATRRVLQKAGLSLEDIDLAEVNEAFASIPLAWQRELGFDLAKLNVNGGAIALGHPLGATGAILVATLLNELERRDLRHGLIAICMGYGMGIAAVLDRKVD